MVHSTEPAASPENVQATSISSTAIMVIWEEVPAIDRSGIIINYEVRFEPLQFTAELSTGTINTPDLSVTITGLEEYVEYNISVRAYTSVGPGPYSGPVTERIQEDGKIPSISLSFQSLLMPTFRCPHFMLRFSKLSPWNSPTVLILWFQFHMQLGSKVMSVLLKF